MAHDEFQTLKEAAGRLTGGVATQAPKTVERARGSGAEARTDHKNGA